MKFRNRPRLLLGLLVTVVILAVLWVLVSPEDVWRPERLQDFGRRFADTAWFVWTVFIVVIIAQQLAIPHLVLVVLGVLLLGLLQGFFVVYSATLAGAVIGYLMGRLFGQDLLQRYASPRVERVHKALARRGLETMIVINLFPMVPHTVINLVAGTSRLRFHHFLLGTAIGLVPSTLVIALATQTLLHFARMPTAIEAFVAMLVTGLAVLGLWLFARRLWRRLGGD